MIPDKILAWTYEHNLSEHDLSKIIAFVKGLTFSLSSPLMIAVQVGGYFRVPCTYEVAEALDHYARNLKSL